jgi:hypothetical protein
MIIIEMKRKQSDLRTNPINMHIGKYSPRPSMFGVDKLQPFFPPIECLFKTNVLDNSLDYGIKFPDPIVSSTNSNIRTLSGKIIETHQKITMLMGPFNWMKGEHRSLNLPSANESANSTHQKLQSYNTAGYVGSILSSALSLSGCRHFPTVYGVYSGIAEKHTIDISDDYEELSERTWFSSNIGKTFDLKLNENAGEHIQYTRSARIPVEIGEDIQLEGVEELEGVPSEAIAADLNAVFEDESEHDDETSSKVSTSYIFDIESVGTMEEDSESECEDDEPFAWATFKEVPVQLTVMEKLEGTLYDLFTQFPDSDKHYAWLCQIVFALAFAQRTFGFTHNDLHGNNVMFVKTSEEFFYYSYSGETYAVPTYGYLLKIIDFDRGIGSIKIQGMKEARTFMSDQFHEKEEAGGQYNIEPFYNSHYQIIKPNSSFDLARLATSMFWDLFPNGPKFEEYLDNPVFKLLVKWMSLPDGTSVLFSRKCSKVDRYMGFDLYKAIARYSKDAIPRKEISEFKQFISEVPIGSNVLVIDL